MRHEFRHDVCVIGAGRIGLPWATSLAVHGRDVICVDVDEAIVESINGGTAPFDEPSLDELLSKATEVERLHATTDSSAVSESRVVASTLNAPNDQIDQYQGIVGDYAAYLSPEQTFINRTTLPVPIITEVHETIAEGMRVSKSGCDYITFPERLAEGRAIEEIDELPKVVGTHNGPNHEVIEWLTAPFSGETQYTDHETAMFVKLIDNTYRDARFAIANQFAIVAEEVGLDAHEAIRLANSDYPRNDVPLPGTVGGKCLTKDPYFMTSRWIDDLPVDLFADTRCINETFEQRIVKRVLGYDPETVAVLGTGFKKDTADEVASPAITVIESLTVEGISVDSYDPHRDTDRDLEDVVPGADVVLVAVNHTAFADQRDRILELATGVIVDVWGLFEPGADVDRVGSEFKRELTPPIQSE